MRAGPECPRFFCNSFHRETAHRSAWHSRLARVWDTSIESQRGSDGALDHSSTRTIQYTLDSRAMSQHKTDNTTDTDTPTWDMAPSTLSVHLERLRRWLPEQDNAYSSLIRKGTIYSGKSTIIPTATWLAELSELDSDFTFAAPSPVKLEMPTALNQSAERGVYVVNPGAIDAKDEAMMRDILRTIQDPSSKDDYEHGCRGSGRRLLTLLHDEAARITKHGANTVLAEMYRVEQAGIEGIDLASFNAFKSRIEELNRSLPQPFDESHIATRLTTAISHLDHTVGDKVDVRLESRSAALGFEAAALPYDQVITVCRAVIATHSEQLRTAAIRAGRSLNAVGHDQTPPHASNGDTPRTPDPSRHLKKKR